MFFIVALLLAWPTSGLSLLVYFVYKVFYYIRLKQEIRRKIEAYIVSLSTLHEGIDSPIDGLPGTPIGGLTYTEVRDFVVSERDYNVMNIFGNHVLFSSVINNVTYKVKLNRLSDQDVAIMTSRQMVS